jgi:hypothetical protein
MGPMGEHELKPIQHRDHLWVVFVIAACCVFEVWASWVTIGSLSGFPKIGGPHGFSTDWTLAVTTEAYWGYALYSWLAAAPGPRSRRFAMWSAGAVFILSLTGQGAAHLLKPGQQPGPALVVFVTSLPVITLALIAVLVHLRQLDREEAEETQRAAERREREAARLRAENDERTALRKRIAEMTAGRAEADEAHERTVSDLRDAHAAEVSDLRAELSARLAETASAHEAEASGLRSDLETAQEALADAQAKAGEALARADALTAKLEALTASKKRQKAAGGTRARARSDGDSDLTNELRALMELQADPGLRQPRMGGELARRLGIGASTGRRLHGALTKDGALSEYAESLIQAPAERSE